MREGEGDGEGDGGREKKDVRSLLLKDCELPRNESPCDALLIHDTAVSQLL